MNCISKKPDATKIAMLSAVGPAALERYNHFEWCEGEDKNKFDHVKAKFEKEFAGQKRIVFKLYSQPKKSYAERATAS